MPRTGPRTPEGKAVASRNAVRHGLYSAAVVVADEMLADWQAFLESFLASLEPRAGAETELACRAASLLWRLRRVPVAEANLTARDAAREARYAERRARIRNDGKDLESPETYYASVLPAPDPGEPPPLPLPEVDHLETVSRYESRLNRQLLRIFHQLDVLQGRRRNRRVSLARVDVPATTEK